MAANPYKRHRLIWSLFLSAAALLFFIYLRLDVLSNNFDNWDLPLRRPQPPSAPEKLNDFKALLYMISNSDIELPEDFNVTATPLHLKTLSGGENWSTSEWNKRIRLMDKLNPLIVFSKTYCPFSQKAKRLLARYDIYPTPRIVEVDIRSDKDLIKSLLGKFTSHSTFPNIVIRGKSFGGSDELQSLHDSGGLRKLLEKEGLSVGVREEQLV